VSASANTPSNAAAARALPSGRAVIRGPFAGSIRYATPGMSTSPPGPHGVFALRVISRTFSTNAGRTVSWISDG
jgi:hypothetical protein